ncbi:MAG TPA: ABC transporter substrate-binding protein [Micropepsaceae bacterium]|nr:ABC transporter substrate-binding protein [Micropepsaceae bacterium]
MLKRVPAAFAMAALCVTLIAPQARANPATETFIQQNFDKGYQILNNMALSDADRRRQFRDLLLELAATRRIALFTLGTYAMGAAPTAVDDYVEAFKKYSIAVYERGLNRYEGQALKVTGSTDRAADDSVVQAEITSPNEASKRPVKLGFRVRKSETGAPTITDLLLDGVSLATTERDEFTSYLKSHDGSIPELTKRLVTMAENPQAPN